ncbi:Thioredoxin-like superfamily [Sesbania bispinosa]|nr:Thioredoxin-like superfamily [Sesbania bispinosa]
MWPPWLSSHRRDRTTVSSPSRTRSYGSSCCSFKDIQTILQPEPEPTSPKSPPFFRCIRASTSFLRSFSARTVRSSIASPPDSDHSTVVVYYTSLRIVRRTFNDCRSVRSILRRFDVSIDERDVSVDDRFREELKEILGRRNVPLPSVFVGGEHIGGVDDLGGCTIVVSCRK